MAAIDSFTTLVNFTTATYLSGPKRIMNAVQRQNYGVSYFMRNKNAKKVLRHTHEIREKVLDNTSASEWYGPNPTVEFENPQFGVYLAAGYRKVHTKKAWSDDEIILQAPKTMSAEARAETFLDIDNAKSMAAWTGHLNTIDDALFLTSAHGSARYTAIESGLEPYNLGTHIIEDTTNYHPNGWTNIEGRDPANDSWHRNQVERYHHPSYLNGTNSLYNAFCRMRNKVNWNAPPQRKNFFEDTEQDNKIILTSNNGTTIFRDLLSSRNDRTYNPQDPWYPNPMFEGIPVLYVKGLDTAAWYYDGSSYVAEDASTLLDDGTAWSTSDWTLGPRFYWCNTQSLYPVFHAERFMRLTKAMNTRDQPESWGQRIVSYMQFFCSKRWEQGIVGPGATA